MPYSVYIIRCKDSKLYTGITTDLKRRIKEHNSGNGCRFTKYRTPVKLVHHEDGLSKPAALRREAGIKSLTRKEKLALIRKNRDLRLKRRRFFIYEKGRLYAR